VFTLQAQEGRLFSAAGLHQDLCHGRRGRARRDPGAGADGLLIRGRIPRRAQEPAEPAADLALSAVAARVLRCRAPPSLLSLLVLLSTLIPLAGVGGLLAPLKWPFPGRRRRCPAPRWAWATGREAAGSRRRGPSKAGSRARRCLARDLRGVPVLETGTGPRLRVHAGPGRGRPDVHAHHAAGLSIGKAQELLQQTDRLIASMPEVERVFGKIGRADTATDPAPLTMIETLIQLKPRGRVAPRPDPGRG
jgi:Cu(I)/Ag(I) efflux system membrane protein CusA/SilA